MNFSSKRIGILGGLGAAASARLHTFLIEECQRRGATLDSDFPEVLHLSLSSTSVDAKGVAYPEQLIMELNKGLSVLEGWLADQILIGCNSAFAHTHKLQMVKYERIVNIPEIVHRHCKQDVGVICSQTSREDGLYSWAKHVEKRGQRTVNRIIAHSIGGRITAKDRKDLYCITYDLWNCGCKTVVLGCTELALAMPYRLQYVVDAGELAIKEMLN